MIHADTLQGYVHGKLFEVLECMKPLLIVLILLTMIIEDRAEAHIPRLLYRQSPQIYQPVLLLPELKISNTWTKQDIEKIVPYRTIVPHSNSDDIVKKIADKSFQQFFEQPQFKNSVVGRFTQQMKEYFKFEINLNNLANNISEINTSKEVKEVAISRNVLKQQPRGVVDIEHKLHFNYAAFESRAEFKYTGWTEAILNYELMTSKSEIQIRKNIFNNKQVYLSHVGTKTADLNTMGVLWGF